MVPLGVIGCLYRYEFRLVTRGQAIGLAALRLAIVSILWCAIALQPRLLAIHVVETPGRVRIAVDLSSSMDVVDRDQSKSRRAIVGDLLSPTGKNLLDRLAEKHALEIVGFHERKFDLASSQLRELLLKPSIETLDTNLGLGLADATSRREANRSWASYFSVTGSATSASRRLRRAAELDKMRVPIYPSSSGRKRRRTI